MMALALTGGKRRQTTIGLALALGLIAAYLVIHLLGIFAWAPSVLGLALLLPAILVQTWLSTGLFIVAHDAMHGSLAPGRPRLNRAIGTLCLALYAQLSYRQFLPKHLDHHRYPGSDRDPDFHAGPAAPWFTRFFGRYYSPWQMVRIAAVAGAYMWLGAAYLNILLFWALPSLLALGQLFAFGTWLPHRQSSEAFADRHNARSASYGRFVSLLTCFHFGGYHHEHHLYPGVPWWALPRARRHSAASMRSAACSTPPRVAISD